ncbi:hypothetical protein AVEN_53197-1 [Araneus ventricosus]|uniref:Reverse transcriptase domain-containing protein n=1 Tax=Araneus ventricosus TaxID=182803 RepID=A0A4Y2AA34_ARAVE|nr:hypothetical protein AVEN_53197-1 [Araneus ventricosus]
MEIKRICSKGCPKGSVISPNLWNLYMNQLLSLNSDTLFLQAFADDLALVSASRVREELENNTNKALNAIANKLRDLKLDLSVDKCQDLAFRSNVHYRQRRGQIIFNRNPIFKINGQSVKIGNSLKYLGILLDCILTWSNHILSFHKKIYKLTFNFNMFMKANWKMDKHLVKFCKSSIDALKSHRTKSNFVNSIKNKFRVAERLAGLTWVKANAGIPGNELADQFAKLATTNGELMNLSLPYSYLKLQLKRILLESWNDRYTQYQSASGTRVWAYVLRVDEMSFS